MNIKPNFFPMRPTATGKIPTIRTIAGLRDKFTIQPKLNGDRVVLWVMAGEVYTHNRHGSEYKMMVRNRNLFTKLPVGTILDGEVFGGKFFPFECLSFGDIDYTANTAETRCKLAECICYLLGIEWLFAEPTESWLAAGSANGSEWEGVVIRLRNSAYVPCKKPFHESDSWFKLKW